MFVSQAASYSGMGSMNFSVLGNSELRSGCFVCVYVITLGSVTEHKMLGRIILVG